jgi:hypothetical protein
LRKALTMLAASVAVLTAFAPAARAEDAAPQAATARPYNDFLFPGSGNVSVTASTGVPYTALGEVSVGIGDRFAVGGLVTGGPFLGGVAVGINPRVDAVRFGPMRLVLEAPVVWYPDVQNTDNWVLIHPDARIEGKAGRFRVHGSVGALYAKMVGAQPVAGPVAPYGGAGLPSGVQQGALWNTTGAGVAFAMSPSTSVFAEGFVMTQGLQAAGTGWFALPGAAFVGLTTTL